MTSALSKGWIVGAATGDSAVCGLKASWSYIIRSVLTIDSNKMLVVETPDKTNEYNDDWNINDSRWTTAKKN